MSGSAPNGPRSAFLALPLGTRVVVRYLIEGGATDVLGELTRMTATQCAVRTRSGDLVTVLLANILAAKAIPPPPAPRLSRLRGNGIETVDIEGDRRS